MRTRIWAIVAVQGALTSVGVVRVPAQESGRLVGVVVSESRELPVPGALVALDAGIETTADEDGLFVLEGVRAGPYRIAAVGPGCHVGLGEVQVEGGREIRLRLTIPFTPEAEDRLEAWTLGTRSLGQSVKTLTAEQIRKRHVQTVVDALRIIAPEMVIGDASQVGDRLSLRNRGAPTVTEGAEPLVILDGVRVPQHSIDPLFGVSPEDIERIEVMRGGAGGWRYGIQGANGVVRITTRQAFGGYAAETPPLECAFRFPR